MHGACTYLIKLSLFEMKVQVALTNPPCKLSREVGSPWILLEASETTNNVYMNLISISMRIAAQYQLRKFNQKQFPCFSLQKHLQIQVHGSMCDLRNVFFQQIHKVSNEFTLKTVSKKFQHFSWEINLHDWKYWSIGECFIPIDSITCLLTSILILPRFGYLEHMNQCVFHKHSLS